MLREPRETCLLVQNSGLLPNMVFPKAPVVLVLLGWTNPPVVDPNPFEPNVPVVPKPVGGGTEHARRVQGILAKCSA